MAKRIKDINQAVREVCMSFPEVEEVEAHGSPDFRVAGKTFATYTINHHGDGNIALWLRMPPGGQQYYVENEPDQYFVPAYVGPKGWLGVHLDRKLSWKGIAARVRSAYEEVAPKSLSERIGETIDIVPPSITLKQEDFDPLGVPKHAKRLDGLRKRCLQLPEVSESTSFGNPVWRAGKKTFVTAYANKKQIYYSFWVGVENQPHYDMDPRFHIPAYTGHNGWISLNVTKDCHWPEVESLIDTSYRHFALKRMLKALA
ncbi:MAG: MmcQ/YjbR family DNA-binding protein [Pseudomonadales bacterium]